MPTNKLRDQLKRLGLLFTSVVGMCSIVVAPPVAAAAGGLSPAQTSLYNNNVLFHDIDGGAATSCSPTATPTPAPTPAPTPTPTPTPGPATPGGSNLDYAGNPILDQTQLSAITANQSVYQQAATQVGIPWQMLAVIHLRESGLKVANPGNGQGVFQFADMHGGPYPAGPVTQQEFLRQAVLAAQFLQSIAAGNYAGNQTLTATSTADTIKDTFFSYNGRAGVYAAQAASLGFSATTQGYEGSPYVMNKADAKRDPASNPTGWGQIKVDGGSLSYPANPDYGAYVTYAALTGGLSSNGSCLQTGTVDCTNPSNATQGLSTVRQNVVCLTQQELALWTAGTLSAGVKSYGKYNNNTDELWCADFVSWIYDQAKYPFQPDPGWRIPGVEGMAAIGQKNQNFHYHDAASYTPKPGDVAYHYSANDHHVNIVVGVSGTTITLVGGDQPGNGSYPDGSVVNEYPITGFTGNDIVGYISPD